MASTGISTDAQTSRSRSIPCGAPKRRLGRRREHRPKENIVRSAPLGRARRFQGMAGNANQKIHPAGRAAPLATASSGKGLFPKVNSRGVRGQRDIQPVIDQNTRWSRTRFGNRETHQLDKRARLEVLFTNLNPVCSRRQPRGGWIREASASESEIGDASRVAGEVGAASNARRSVT